MDLELLSDVLGYTGIGSACLPILFVLTFKKNCTQKLDNLLILLSLEYFIINILSLLMFTFFKTDQSFLFGFHYISETIILSFLLTKSLLTKRFLLLLCIILIGVIFNFFIYDFLLPETKTIIEVNGDFFHANPNIYCEYDDIPLPSGISKAKDIWNKDQRKIDFAKQKGYNVIIVWEHEINYRIETVKDKLLNV